MIVQCGCGARYRYDEKRFQGATEKKARCPKCERTLTLVNPDLTTTRTHEEVLKHGIRNLEKPQFSIAIRRGGIPWKVITLDKEKTIIGRTGADIEIDDPEASRNHAELEVAGEDLILRDLNSRNGTLMNGQKIKDVVLDDQSEFQIGQSFFQVHKVLLSFD